MALAAEKPDWFGSRIQGAALIATSSGRMNEVGFGLPARIAALGHQRVGDFSKLLLQRREQIERRRAAATDLTYVLNRLYSFGGPTSQSHTRFVTEMLNATPIDVLAEFLPEFDRHDKVEALAAFQRVDTLVLVGDRDVLTPKAHSREIVRHVPGAEFVVLPTTGHMIMSERYPQVNEHLRALTASVRHHNAGTPGD